MEHGSGDDTAVIIASPLTLLGGVAKYWQRLAPRLIDAGIDVSFVTGVPELDGRERERLGMNRKAVQWFRHVLIPEIKASTASWVITSIPQSDMLFALFGRKTVQRPWIIFVQGQPYPLKGQTAFLRRLVWKRLWLWAARRADLVIAVSETAAALVPHGPPVRVLPPLPPEPRAGAASTQAALTLGFLGRMSMEKDPALFARIAAHPSIASAVAYGDGDLLEEMRAAAPHVDWRGATDDPTAALESFSTLLLTSRSEGLPLVILEASIFGVPFIATAVGGISTITHPENRSLMLVPVEQREDVSAWVSRIQKLDDRETRDRAVQLQKEWVQQNFDPERTVGELTHLLRELR